MKKPKKLILLLALISLASLRAPDDPDEGGGDPVVDRPVQHHKGPTNAQRANEDGNDEGNQHKHDSSGGTGGHDQPTTTLHGGSVKPSGTGGDPANPDHTPAHHDNSSATTAHDDHEEHDHQVAADTAAANASATAEAQEAQTIEDAVEAGKTKSIWEMFTVAKKAFKQLVRDFFINRDSKRIVEDLANDPRQDRADYLVDIILHDIPRFSIYTESNRYQIIIKSISRASAQGQEKVADMLKNAFIKVSPNEAAADGLTEQHITSHDSVDSGRHQGDAPVHGQPTAHLSGPPATPADALALVKTEGMEGVDQVLSLPVDEKMNPNYFVHIARNMQLENSAAEDDNKALTFTHEEIKRFVRAHFIAKIGELRASGVTDAVIRSTLQDAFAAADHHESVVRLIFSEADFESFVDDVMSQGKLKGKTVLAIENAVNHQAADPGHRIGQRQSGFENPVYSPIDVGGVGITDPDEAEDYLDLTSGNEDGVNQFFDELLEHGRAGTSYLDLQPDDAAERATAYLDGIKAANNPEAKRAKILEMVAELPIDGSVEDAEFILLDVSLAMATENANAHAAGEEEPFDANMMQIVDDAMNQYMEIDPPDPGHPEVTTDDDGGYMDVKPDQDEVLDADDLIKGTQTVEDIVAKLKATGLRPEERQEYLEKVFSIVRKMFANSADAGEEVTQHLHDILSKLQTSMLTAAAEAARAFENPVYDFGGADVELPVDVRDELADHYREQEAEFLKVNAEEMAENIIDGSETIKALIDYAAALTDRGQAVVFEAVKERLEKEVADHGANAKLTADIATLDAAIIKLNLDGYDPIEPSPYDPAGEGVTESDAVERENAEVLAADKRIADLTRQLSEVRAQIENDAEGYAALRKGQAEEEVLLQQILDAQNDEFSLTQTIADAEAAEADSGESAAEKAEREAETKRREARLEILRANAEERQRRRAELNAASEKSAAERALTRAKIAATKAEQLAEVEDAEETEAEKKARLKEAARAKAAAHDAKVAEQKAAEEEAEREKALEAAREKAEADAAEQEAAEQAEEEAKAKAEADAAVRAADLAEAEAQVAKEAEAAAEEKARLAVIAEANAETLEQRRLRRKQAAEAKVAEHKARKAAEQAEAEAAAKRAEAEEAEQQAAEEARKLKESAANTKRKGTTRKGTTGRRPGDRGRTARARVAR